MTTSDLATDPDAVRERGVEYKVSDSSSGIRENSTGRGDSGVGDWEPFRFGDSDTLSDAPRNRSLEAYLAATSFLTADMQTCKQANKQPIHQLDIDKIMQSCSSETHRLVIVVV